MAKKCSCCVSLKSATLTCGLVSLIVSMSMVTASVTSIFYTNSISTYVLIMFSINGIVDLVASVSCIHAVCTESAKYLLPWIFTTSVGIIFMFVVSLSYMMYRIDDYILFGLILFLIATFFAIGWVCVLSYYYQLCDKNNERAMRRRRRNVINNSEHSTNSLSTVIVDDYRRTPPPPYGLAYYKNPVFTGDEDDKLPSYEEIIRESESSAAGAISSNNSDGEGRRF